MLLSINIATICICFLGQCTTFCCCSSTNVLRGMSTREGYYHEGYFHENQVSSTDNDSYCSSWCSPLKCTNKVPLLRLGHCMTFEEDKGMFTVRCPYFQLKEHNVTKLGYIQLPSNISELNDYMCKPMNRKGFLCKDCIDGFGPSVTSVGYMCSNCTAVQYGVPLYLLVELLPVTVFYVVLFVLQIRLTSAPMTCFIMYSQLIVLELVVDRKIPVDLILPTNPLLRVTLVFYGIWNLDFFRYALPPFCVSSRLQLIHIALLGYISILYPVCLIILSWICIELHDRNCQFLVWLWSPFHKCLVQLRRTCRGIQKRDIIDVFAAFFLLSYSKLVYQSFALLKCTAVCSSQHKGTEKRV